MSEIIKRRVDTNWFIETAARNDWPAFDSRILEVCNLKAWVKWTEVGVVSKILDERDLAVSILEKTRMNLDGNKTKKLIRLMAEDENLHLRRKAAIALWRHGNRCGNVVSRLNEALSDDELREEVRGLLSESIK